MSKEKIMPSIGSVGYYLPDPGHCKSPNMVLAVHEHKVVVFEVPTRMSFLIDKEDWGSVDQMEQSTLSILDKSIDSESILKLRGRIRAMADAHRLLEGRIKAVLSFVSNLDNLSDDTDCLTTLQTIKRSLIGNPAIGGAFDQ